MSDLAIGIVGLGRMGAFHLETWEHVEGAQVVAVAEPDANLAHERIGRRPIAHFESHRDLVVAQRRRCDLHHGALRAARQHRARRDRRRQARARREADRHHAGGWAAHDRRRARGGRQADGRPRRALQPGRRQAQGADRRWAHRPRVPRARHARRPDAPAHPGRRRRDRPGHARPRHHAVRPRARHLAHLRGGRAAVAPHAGGHDRPACCASATTAPFGLLDVNWLTPEKRREISVIGEDGMLTASYLTQDVWFTESPTAQSAGTSSRRIRGDAEGAALRFALRRVEPLKAELEAFAACVLDDTAEPISAYDGCRRSRRPGGPRLGRQLPSRDPARHAQPGAARGRRLARRTLRPSIYSCFSGSWPGAGWWLSFSEGMMQRGAAPQVESTSTEALARPSAPTAPIAPGLEYDRFFTREGMDPFDEVDWELRSASSPTRRGELVFEQRDVEIPVLVAAGHQHRRLEILPRGSARRARAQRQAAHRPRRRHDHDVGARAEVLRDAKTTCRRSATT